MPRSSIPRHLPLLLLRERPSRMRRRPPGCTRALRNPSSADRISVLSDSGIGLLSSDAHTPSGNDASWWLIDFSTRSLRSTAWL